MARENPAQILSIETNDEPSEAISTHIPRNAKGRIRQRNSAKLANVLVAQNSASWNQLAGWLREIAALREAV